MGVISNVIEREGVPTSQISMIREHTEMIRPPRALWVPFELGRPFGAPEDESFQTAVLVKALELFERDSGPVLEDYAVEAPDEHAPDGWQQKAGLPVLTWEEISAHSLGELLARELEAIRLLHDVAWEKRDRTTVGVSRLKTREIVRLLNTCIEEQPIENPHPHQSLGLVLKLASEDFKAFYLEAASFHASASSSQLSDWFWDQTAAGEVLRSLRAFLKEHQDQWVRAFAKFMLVPEERILRTR